MDTPAPTLYNREAEDALLSAILTDGEIIENLSVEPGDFHDRRAGWTFAAMRALASANTPIDIVTLADRMRHDKTYDEAGGNSYLMGLYANYVSSLNAAHYAEIVTSHSRRRKLLSVANELAKAACSEQADADAIIARTMDSLLHASTGDGEFVKLDRLVSAAYDEVSYNCDHPRDLSGVSTGFPDLDKTLDGLQAGQTVIIAGEPGKGKSLLAYQVCANAARTGAPVAFFSMEMPAKQVILRQLSAATREGSPLNQGVTTRQMKKGQMRGDDHTLFTKAIEATQALPIWISDYTGWTTVSLRAKLTAMKKRHGIKIFCVDYDELLKDTLGKDKNERDSYISRALHDVAKDLSMCGIIIHKLNKNGMDGTIPDLQHLSGAAAFSYDADDIFFIVDHVAENPNPAWRTLVPAKRREDDAPEYINLVKLAGYPLFGSVATGGTR